jgi:hypothetical protein
MNEVWEIIGIVFAVLLAMAVGYWMGYETGRGKR